MRYYLDCEFDGGNLLSLALVSADGREMYMAVHSEVLPAWDIDEWVAQNVVPIITCPGAKPEVWNAPRSLAEGILDLVGSDPEPEFVADWPTDFQFLLPVLHDNMGNMIDLPSFKCSVVRVDAYPTKLEGAVQHNALWDARALRHKLEGDQS